MTFFHFRVQTSIWIKVITQHQFCFTGKSPKRFRSIRDDVEAENSLSEHNCYVVHPTGNAMSLILPHHLHNSKCQWSPIQVSQKDLSLEDHHQHHLCSQTKRQKEKGVTVMCGFFNPTKVRLRPPMEDEAKVASELEKEKVHP